MRDAPGALHSLHNSAMTQRDALTLSFNQLLEPERFKDYGPNGLSIEVERTFAFKLFEMTYRK